jgi:4-hydroxybenzoate polyprenyltransferase
LNEYIDVDIDRLSPDLSKKPLVKGSVSMQGALGVILTSVSMTYILTILIFPSFWILVILTLSHLCGVIYDVYGKKFPGSDFVLAAWIFLFCLFGAMSADFTLDPFEMPFIIYILSGLGFMQIVFNNAVEGGLKDVDHDHIGDARTLATVLGVKVKKSKLKISTKFRTFTWSIKIFHILLFFTLFFNSDLAFWEYEHFYVKIILLLFIFILIGVIFFTTYRFLNFQEFDRSKLKRIFSIHEISTYFIVPLILVPLLGLPISMGLLFLPLIWFICLNLVLYGKPLEPQV